MADFPEYPPDFLPWANALRAGRLSMREVGTSIILVYRPGHTHPTNPNVKVMSEVLAPPHVVAAAADWRQLVAYYIRGLRLHCRRQTGPIPPGGFKELRRPA